MSESKISPFFIINRLSHSFYKKNNKIELFKNISFSLKENEIVAITGKSGIGKSTFLNLAAGLDNALSGEIIFRSKKISHLKENQLAKIRNQEIGFVFQHFNLIRELSVLENVVIPAIIYRSSNEKIKQKALHLLREVGLGDRLEHSVAELSGGEMQRTAIARALINQPKLIFADEPTGNLDEKNSSQIMEIFKKLCRANKCGVIIVTHSISLAEKCDLIYEIKNKNIVQMK